MLRLHSAMLGDRWLGCHYTTASCRLPRPGGVRSTDRNGVGCSHREGCPLFPLLKESLRGWRDHYCDHGDGWRDCARYKMSLTGQLVPITLLPNGHDAQYLPDADRSGALAEKHALPLRPSFGSAQSPVPRPRFEPRPAPTPARPLEPSPPVQVPQPPANPPVRVTPPAQRGYGSTPRWWIRLTDWMRGPA
jgi:hypothetical protein